MGLTPYLYILCAEVLGKMIRNNRVIKGIEIEGIVYRISQYADVRCYFLTVRKDQ